MTKELFSGCLPDQLCVGQTTLVPEEAGTSDPACFRPITVSSVLVRQFHQILARRLDKLRPVGIAQKGFCCVDGCAENSLLLLTAGTNSRNPSKLFIGYLDVRKAFDSVSHESLMLACQRIGVPEPLVSYISGVYRRSQTQTEARVSIDGETFPALSISDP